MPILPQGEHRRVASSIPPSLPPPIQASVSYVCRAGELPVNHVYEPPAGTPREDCTYEPRVIEIHDCPDHRWWYVPAMERHEVLVFKQYDSATDVARFTPHAAFDHPAAPPGCPPRQSIEARCLVTYD